MGADKFFHEKLVSLILRRVNGCFLPRIWCGISLVSNTVAAACSIAPVNPDYY